MVCFPEKENTFHSRLLSIFFLRDFSICCNEFRPIFWFYSLGIALRADKYNLWDHGWSNKVAPEKKQANLDKLTLPPRKSNDL